ncbi:formate dehydrogenase subunit delta [Stella sp.]|uniref:formate dehydrogenase subunit delta n=1 Tax=Stella sp. TaxID=2912054 RepID=UPI0035B2996A
MSSDRIDRMANQIARFFASRPEAEAVAGTEDHIVKFWDPRMRAALIAHLAAGGADLSPIARQAAERLRDRQAPSRG